MQLERLLYKTFRNSLLIFILGCTTDDTPEVVPESKVIPEPEVLNTVPVMADQQFEVSESIGGFKTIATIVASDSDNDVLKFKLESDVGLIVKFDTGEIRTTSSSVLDFETATSLSFDVSVSDTKGGKTVATITINILNEDDGPLTNYQKNFVEEYIYLTYKLSPSASGGVLSEKWSGQINLFLDGNVPANYQETALGYLEDFNSLFSDGTNATLVNSQAESNVHLIIGAPSSIQQVWPDMFDLIDGQNFGGYALYNTNQDYNIHIGRIWLKSPGEGIFKHELGHIIGLGHTSDSFCEGGVKSVMCSVTAIDFNLFDKQIIMALYRPETSVGLSQNQMRELINEYLLQGDIVL